MPESTATRPPSREGRWLQIVLVVAFVLEVGNAVLGKSQLMGEGYPLFPSLFSGRGMHLPGAQRWLLLGASGVLFLLWQARTRRRLAAPPERRRKIALLDLSSMGFLGQRLAALELELPPAVLFVAWRCSALAALCGLWFLGFGGAVSLSPSRAGFLLEIVSSIGLACACFTTFLLVDLHQRLATSEAGAASAPPPGAAITAAAAAAPASSAAGPAAAAPAPAAAPATSAVPELAPPSPGADLPGDRCPDCRTPSRSDVCLGCGAALHVRRYAIEKLLGKREYSRTYLARSPDRRRVVLKEVSLSRVPDIKTLEAFETEARLLARLQHPQVPRFLEHFTTGEGASTRFYLAHAFLPGVSLEEELWRGRLDPAQTAAVVEDCLTVLAYLHGQTPRVIHRDIKPANLIRLPHGGIGVVDFGGARELESAHLEGTLVGTVGYMPPEQLGGRVDETSDLYALGVTAVHLLTGIAPAELLGEDARLRLPALPVPRRLQRFYRRLAEPKRSARFPSAHAALRALERAEGGTRAWPVLGGVGLVLALGTAAAVGLDLPVLERLRLAAAGPERLPVEALPPDAAALRGAAVPPDPAALRGASVPEPPPLAAAAEPVPPAGDPRVVATFPRGQITLGELDAELRSLPPGLKHRTTVARRLVARTLAERRALAVEARSRGLATPGETGPAGERRAIRALLAAEGLHAPANHGEGPGHRRRFLELVARSLGGAVEIDEASLEGLVVDERAPIEPPGPGTAAPPQPFFLDLSDGRCDGALYPEQGWYMGFCDDGDTLLEGLLPGDVLYLESTYGPVEGFLHRLAFDGRVRPVLSISAGGARTAEAMPAPMTDEADRRYGLRLDTMEVTGTVPRDEAIASFKRVAPAFRHCLAYTHWNSRYPERSGTLEVRLRVGAGRVQQSSSRLLGFTEPERVRGAFPVSGFNHEECLASFATYRMVGEGEITLRLVVELR